MLLLQTQQLTKSYGATTILDRVDIQIRNDDRIGLVGVNGAGKSTLLQLLAGKLTADSGTLQWAKGCRFGYLAQQTSLDSHRSLWDECMTVFAHVKRMERELRELERQMSEPTVLANENRHAHIMQQYADLQEAFEKAEGYSHEARIRSVLDGLGLAKFSPRQTLVSTLSGGQKTRLALAKLLLEQPDLLMLDEPTNYLDLATLEWLETFLKTYRGALLIVSHDRYFLDRLVRTVWELEHASLTVYHGNYTRFVEQKEQQRQQLEKRYLAQQAKIKQMETFVQRNIARASTSKRAQSRRKALEKIERINLPKAGRKHALMRFEVERMSGREVMVIEDVKIGYSKDQPLSRHLHLRLARGERVALVGPNGIGKTTLLKTISRSVPPLSGDIQYGSNVTTGYYDQEQSHLDPNKTVLDELWDNAPLRTEQDIRDILGHFLFSGDDVLKRVEQLSGGEKARLSLAELSLKRANVLLLDEPTNHLDIYNKEQLEKALQVFPGTLLFISHDRYFINQLATRVVELTRDGLTSYLGNYDDYLAKKAALIAQEKEKATPPPEGKTGTRRQTYRREQQRRNEKRKRARLLAETETHIEKLEQSIQEKEQLLAQPDNYTDHARAIRLQNEINELTARLDEALEYWSELAEHEDRDK